MKESSRSHISIIDRFRRNISKAIWPWPTSGEELIELIRTANKKEFIENELQDIIERALRVSSLQVRDVMIPRVLMITIDLDSTFEKILEAVTSSGHSRFPVVKESLHDVEAEGILLAKDILAHVSENGDHEFNLYDALREVMYVAESMRLNALLKRFQEKHNHMAIVVNEYNAIAGLVTIEDVLEQIVGEIEDESDLEESEKITQIEDDLYAVNALTDIAEFNERFNVKFNEDVDTVGGLVFKTAGYVPNVGETFDLDGLILEVANADERKIILLRVKRNYSAESTPA